MTISIPFWAIPLILNFIFIGIAYVKTTNDTLGISGLINFGMAFILILITWLIYFIIF